MVTVGGGGGVDGDGAGRKQYITVMHSISAANGYKIRSGKIAWKTVHVEIR